MDLIGTLQRWMASESVDRSQYRGSDCSDLAPCGEDHCPTCGGSHTAVDVGPDDGWEPPY